MTSPCPVKRPISLIQRLEQLIGKQVEIVGSNLALEPSPLQSTCGTTFITVNNELIIPSSLFYVHVFKVPRATKTHRVGLRTAFDSNGLFDDVLLVLMGKQFIEVQPRKALHERYLLPLPQVLGIFDL
ncbi:hypothetical protein [Paenibacillus sp. 481]|uniref:hypothetical protein n=1 Tax=Paenibacillus sp. 481 TaxID=2835869 RepID=UPI001E5C1240|nr:hypothetical protein [Paenibacillus sp. 481]UHA75557.1 hypothetical protein KIK04_11520 [Paenibacillus sp. 481]